MIDTKTFDHLGQQYEVDKICEKLDDGVKPKDAVKQLYPTVPAASIKNIVLKLKKHPYYLARKDMEVSIIKNAGPALQANLIDIALNGKSERNRLDATNSGLDRAYGNAKEDDAKAPQYVFNFSFGGNSSHPKTQERKVIDVDPDN